MRRRSFRLAVLASAVGAVVAFVEACSSSDDPTTPTPGGDGGAEAQSQADTSSGSDVTTSDVVTDGGGGDAAVEAEASVPPLCTKYPNKLVDGGLLTFYELVAERAVVGLASGRCEIGAHFTDYNDPPAQSPCFAKQLISSDIADCIIGGEHIDYSKQTDPDGNLCVGVGAADKVLVGFRNPATSGYTANDYEVFATVTRQAAIDNGMAVADADRLKALVLARRGSVVPDAGAGDAGLSQSTCP